MLGRFFKDSALYAIATAVTGSLGILLLPFLARKLSPQEYGVMDLLLSYFSIVNIIVPLSITQALARYYPKLNLVEEKRLYASTGLWFTFLMYILFLISSIIFIQPITEILIGNKIYTTISIISVVSMLVYGIFYYLQAQLRWMLRPIPYIITNIIFIVFSCFLTILFIEYFQMRLDGYFLARIFASIIAGGVIWYYSKSDYKFVFDIEILKIMLTFSWPLVISSIGIFVSLYIDRFIIRAMLSLTDVGVYSACARVASIAGSVLTVLNFALTPLIYSTYQDPKTPAQLAFLFKIIVYAMLCTTILLLLFSKKILILMVGEQYSEGFHVLPLLVASFIIAGLYNCVPGLWIANKTKLISTINISAAILNTFLCLLLIPYFGYVGAAIATLISSIAALIVSTMYAQKYYYISYDWFKINSGILLTLLFAYVVIRI